MPALNETERFDSREEKLENVRKELAPSIPISDCMDIQKTDRASGLPLLCIDGQVYTERDDSHTIIFGSTGSKKSRLIIMPAVRLLGLAGESMILVDPKAELFDRTAADLIKRGYEIIAINFRNPSVGNCWNPLHIPYRFYKEGNYDRAYEFVNDIVINVMRDTIGLSDPYWDYTAADLLFGLILILFDLCTRRQPKNNIGNYSKETTGPCFTEDDVNISNVIKLRNRLFDNNYLEKSPYWISEKQKNSLISISLMGTVTAPDSKTQPCILSTFDQKMRMFLLQYNLTQMLSKNDFSFDSIGDEGKKHAVFIIMPDEKTTYHKLISLFIKQSYEYLIYKAQQKVNKKFQTRINYLLDEFASLPTINDFPAMISAARSRNIRFNIVIQSQSQMKMKYREDSETIKSNCNNWIFLTSRELSLLTELDELCGKINEKNRVFSKSRLQHFSKGEGEALLLCRRLYPFKTRLLDIDEYDGYDSIHADKWEKIEMKPRDI